jgi:ribosomal protein L7/L12
VTRKTKTTNPGIHGECFVLMPFGGSFDRYYSNIFVPAIENAGLVAVRTDSLFRSSPIMGDIWRLVNQVNVLLADLSGKNPNVFYELGLAHAVGKPVVLVSSNIEDVPFDLRGLRVLIYDKENESWGDELQRSISKSLKETLADVKSAVPPMFFGAQKTTRPPEDPLSTELRGIWAELRALRAEGQMSLSKGTSHPLQIEHTIPQEAFEILSEVSENKAPILVKDAKEIMNQLFSKNKINAIKIIRESTGLSLRQSKDIMDRLDAAIRRGIS